MALIDVSDLLLDADFTDSILVKRQSQSIDDNGRLVTTDEIFNVVCVVTPASPNELDRGEEFDVATRSINVVSKFRLIGESKGFKADIVTWRGNDYVVKTFEPFPQFGQGFYQTVCDSIDRLDSDLSGSNDGQLDFSNFENSQYVGLL